MPVVKPAPLTSLDRRLVFAGGLAGLAAAGSARAADAAFPSRPLIIMAPANPGGGTDQIARLIRSAVAEEHLSPRPMEVVNRGGAGGAIGLAELVSRNHGNPHMIMATGSSVISATVAQKSPFRIIDAQPLARLTIDRMVVAVPAESPFQTIQQFLDAFRRDPASVTWCGGSAGGLDHLLVGLVAEACGVTADKLRYIAYAGSGAASQALLGGQVTAGSSGYSEWRGLAKDGRVRILAAASPERFGDKTVPTFREAGHDIELYNWRGVFAPPGVDPGPLAWWRTLLQRMYASPTWKEYLERNGWEDGYLDGDAFAASVVADQKRYTEILTHLGVGGTSGGYSVIGPYAVPAMVAAGGAVALGATVLEGVREKGKTVIAAGAEDDDEGGGPAPLWKRFFAGLTLTLVYIGALSVVGFLIATPFFVLGLCLLMGSRKIVVEGIAALALTVGVWLLFTRFLYVNLP